MQIKGVLMPFINIIGTSALSSIDCRPEFKL